MPLSASAFHFVEWIDAGRDGYARRRSGQCGFCGHRGRDFQGFFMRAREVLPEKPPSPIAQLYSMLVDPKSSYPRYAVIMCPTCRRIASVE
jgi:hypothetical protein